MLHAALDSDRRAIEAWDRLGGAAALQDIDDGSFRLLPLVYRNLVRRGSAGSELGPLKGIYRRAWFRCHVLLNGGAMALQALHAAGLDTIVLKGAALGTSYYQDPGSRPMDDFDVLVPFERGAEAIAVLRAAGWIPYDPQAESAVLRHHAEPFHAPGNRQLDLHWHLQWEAVDDAAIWDAALPIAIRGVTSQALCPADQLLHVLVHGSSADRVAPIRWVADAVSLLRQQGDEFDWSRLVDQAADRRLTVTTQAALSYLRDSFHPTVPAAVLRSLRRRPTSRAERWAHRARVTPGLPGRKLAIVWERYSKLAALASPGSGFAGLPSFLQQLWGIEHRHELPLELVRRAARHGFSSEK